ncbi:hypothetical protein [Halanaerobacter jeridensis]|uniref:Uncharacterized protein n=1 Tax=Halanaerobacter jeridensis TaxID=706427 RepID=A0A938XVD9_9FIRM|nr:hypothetical protein [Halanaerobacter jeridensis]MBM7558235.1 hypothetical protein [Halanaerobacter jeridensis]
MPVNRSIIKCEVCESLTMVRTQIGYLEEIPIRIPCENCNILIEGELLVNSKDGTWKINFNNAEMQNPQKIEDKEIDYYLETSGELLTRKLIKNNGLDFNNMNFSPFLKNIDRMGHDKIIEFMKRFSSFINDIENIWPKIKRINQLWINESYDYIEKELKKLLPEIEFPMKNKLDFLRGIHKANIFFLWQGINTEKYEKKYKETFDNVDKLISDKPKKIGELAIYFGDEGLLELYEEKVLLQIDKFLNKFIYLAPVFGLQYYDEITQNDIRNKGITTTSFNDIKDLYIDSYEIIFEVYNLVMAFNNLEHRNDFNKMPEKRSDVTELSEFKNQSKGIKLKYLTEEDEEKFDSLLKPYLDNKIRNAIGHNSYKYDAIEEIIYYDPSRNEFSKENAKEIYLLDFAIKCYKTFENFVNILELIYQTRMIYFMTEGLSPSIEFDKYMEELNNL